MLSQQNDWQAEAVVSGGDGSSASASASPAASVRTGIRQSIPSHSIDNCAEVRTLVPSCVSGQTNLPRSSRFA